MNATPERRPHPFLSRMLAPAGSDDAEALAHAVQGKVVLLTGASFGIGRALAKRLAHAGANLLLVARTTDRLHALASEINANGGQARAFSVDLSDSKAVEAFAAQLTAESITPDYVIHNAGKSIRRSLADSLDRPQDAARTMAVNYLGPAQLQLALLPRMLDKCGGHIINVSSVGVRLPPAPLWGPYTASKAAFDTWLRAAAPELSLRGINCSSIYFGLVHTRMSAPTEAYQHMPGLTDDEAAAVVCRAIIERPRVIEPWWVAPLRVLAPWCEGAIHAVFALLLQRAAHASAKRAAPAKRAASLSIAAQITTRLWHMGILRMGPKAIWGVFQAWLRCSGSLVFLAEVAARRFGDALALRDDDGNMSFMELRAAYERLARKLIDDYGAGPGRCIALAERNHRTFIVGLLAAARTGADVVLLNPDSPPLVLDQTLVAQHIDTLLHGPQLDLGIYAKSLNRCTLNVETAGPSVRLPRLKQPGRITILTSSSTGPAKRVARRPTPASVLPPVLGLLESLPISLHQPTVLAVPLFHGHGFATLAMTLGFAAPLYLGRKYEIAPLLARSEEPRAPIVVSVPTLLKRWLASGPLQKNIAAVVTGSAPLPAPLCAQLLEALGPVLYNLYGSSEAGVVALATPKMLAAAPGSVGLPLPGHAVRVVDNAGKGVAAGSVGRIHVRGPLVLRTGADGWLDTGDLGQVDAQGHLFVCGRSDEMLISGGENVYPAQVEACLLTHPAISEAAVTVVEDPEFGQRLHAFVVLRPNETETPESLRTWLSARLERFQIPRRVTLVSVLPRNALGKIDRPALRRSGLVSVLLALVFLCIGALPARANDSKTWEFVYAEQGIKIFNDPSAPLPTFKAEGEIPVNLLDLLAVIADLPRRKEWLTDITMSRILEGDVESRVVIYERMRMPWPVVDRDCVVESVIEKDYEQGIVTVRFQQVEHPLRPRDPKHIRLPVVQGFMRYSYVDATHTYAEYETTLDVGGTLPAWVSKLATRKIPLFTLQALIKQIARTRGQYDAFVREQRAKLKFKDE
jgi:acyl-CoA synthetase (AMP-forming)/AMP-acid ligase II/NAD(P)-dependent dehydrogenase (short-subunit alcohol dehydrogenase family)